MLDVDKLPDHIIMDIAENMGWDAMGDMGPYKERMAHLTPEQAFEKYCNWHGLIGWGHRLLVALDQLREASVEVPTLDKV